MLLLSKRFIGTPILSLRTGQPIGTTTGLLINPNNLLIKALYVQDNRSRQTLMLLPEDIRELSKLGFIVNDREVLAEPDDLLRLKKLFDINFELMGKKVVTKSHQKVGKVSDFAIDSDSLYVQKLIVQRPLLRSISNAAATVDRSQILEITDSKIIVKSTEAAATVKLQPEPSAA